MNNSEPAFKSNAFILAGGKSSRMGTDKGLIDFNGKPMICHVIDHITLYFGTVSIISNNPLYRQFDLPVIEDRIKNIGPAGGILTALQLTDTSWNFFIACDLPYMDYSVIEFLIDTQFKGQAIVPVYNDNTEPLCAFYNVSCIPSLELQIAKANYKLHDLIEVMNVKKVIIPKFIQPQINPFTNINTVFDIKQSVRS